MNDQLKDKSKASAPRKDRTLKKPVVVRGEEKKAGDVVALTARQETRLQELDCI